MLEGCREKRLSTILVEHVAASSIVGTGQGSVLSGLGGCSIVGQCTHA